MVQAINALSTTRVLPASDTPSAYAIAANAWVPTIEHSARVASYVGSAKFRRKVKPTAALATAYAAKVIAWRKHFAGYKRRKIEAIVHPRWLEAAE